MATYTITTPVNIDTLASKVGSDTYNINGGYLTVDQDTRYGVNQNTSAAFGNITLSATLGGTIEFNSTLVRIIPYNTGTGNVPAYGTTISKGGASGKLIGVYSAVNAAPTDPTNAMPASGFIKIRQWNSVAFSSGALTGIGASATGADVAGWLEIVGVDALLVTVNRLNLFKVRGDWYEVGTTTGTRTSAYVLPSGGKNMYCPGVWVETGTSTNVYEFWPCAGTAQALASVLSPDAVRGRWCWVSTTGTMAFGYDGTNQTGGYCPPAGRRVRVPNIFFMTCTSATKTDNVLPNATLATRYEFAITGGGVIDIDKACINWYCNWNQGYSIALTNVAIMSSLVCTELATPIAWSNVGVGQEAANTQLGLSMATCLAGGTMTDCTWTRAAMAGSGAYVRTMTDCKDFTITNERIHPAAGRGNAATGAQSLTRVNSTVFESCLLGGGKSLITTCADLTFNDSIYYDNSNGVTDSALPAYTFELASSCQRVTFDGLTFVAGMTQPYSGVMLIGAAGCTGIKLRNLGTYASPLDMGLPQVDATWTRSTSTATVTSTAHGMIANTNFYVLIASDTSSIAVGAKTVATVVDANTFTFNCSNAGAASGTITYYGVTSANLFVLAGSSAASDVEVKRCYTPHTRTSLYTGDNSAKGVRLESVFGDYVFGPFLTAILNQTTRGTYGSPALTAQVAVYGTHWLDSFRAGVPTSTSGQAWARSGTAVTVTSTGHNLRTGLLINVGTTSDGAAVPKGQYTVTAITSATFTIVGVNAGATSGTLTYDPLIGKLALLMNEASAQTTGAYTLDAGTPAFNSSGGLVMATVNDQVTFETLENVIGMTAFPIAEAVMAGGTIGNYDITYAIDNGSGYGSFHNLAYTRAGGGGSNASTNVTMTSTTGVEAGDYVFGTNIGKNAKVVSITNGTTVVVDIANIGAVSGVLRFAHLPSETVTDASVGFKMKWRIKTTTTNASVAITSLFAYASSTSTSRGYQYALDPVTAKVTCYDAATGSPIQNARVYLVTTGGGPTADGTVVMSQLTDASGIASLTYEYLGDQQVTGRARKGSAAPLYKTGIAAGTITSEGLDASVYLVSDG